MKYIIRITIAILTSFLCLGNMSCGSNGDEEYSGDDKSRIVQNLMSKKWIYSFTDYDVYSYGGAIYTQTVTFYFISDYEGVLYVKSVDDDSALGKKIYEEHIDFNYNIEGSVIYLYNGSNYTFEYFGDYMMEGDQLFQASALTSSDYLYLKEHQEGYHGTAGPIDTEVYYMNESDIYISATEAVTKGWFLYTLQFGFGANDYDAYKKGMTEMRLTVWVENGCLDEASLTTLNYGKKKAYYLALSSTEKDWYNWIFVHSKDSQIVLNYELEYYNSYNGEWYSILSKRLTISKK